MERVFAGRARHEWAQFGAEHDCCLEPVLALDEALDSQLTRGREMVVELAQPGSRRPVRQLGVPVKLSRTPGGPNAPGPVLGEHTRAVMVDLGYGQEEIAQLEDAGVIGGPLSGVPGSFMP